jgi:hypothetical protein
MTQSSVKSVEQGIVQDGFRAQLAQLIRPDQSTRVPRLRLVEGELRLSGHFFEIARLSEWRQAAWENAITQIMYSDSAAQGIIRGSDDIDYNETPIPFIRYIMGQLAPDEWLTPGALTTPLRVFHRGHSPISADKLCLLGWEHGCLAQLIHQKQAYYRPAASTQFQPDKSDPSAYFQPNDHGVIINTKTIPYESLEMVNRIAVLQVNRHQLEAVPDIVRMSKAFLTMSEHPVIDWLTEHSPDFRKARNTINTEWGKLIVHENLLAARVTNLSLRVTLEKTFGDQIIVLSNQFIAFPLELRREIEKAVSKAGHVVKVSRHGA